MIRFLVVFIFFVDLYSNSISQNAFYSKKSEYQTFMHDGLSREYLFYLPANLKAGAPLVFVLHGYTDDASKIRDYSGMNAIADQNGFAVCYPRGTLDSKNNRFWNVGYAFHEGVTIKDIEFLEQLAKFLQQKNNLGKTNTFATGMSNGAEMCYLLACRASDTFRAVAPVAGMMLKISIENCNPGKPVPVFEIHGTNDTINRYDGDINNNDGWGAYLGVIPVLDFWVLANNCSEIKTDTVPNTNQNDNSIIIREKYSGGINGNQVWFYKVINGGHDWPGSSGNMDINTSQEIWSFFNLHISK
jgi:polyhydroxybutyrate depolymerase